MRGEVSAAFNIERALTSHGPPEQPVHLPCTEILMRMTPSHPLSRSHSNVLRASRPTRITVTTSPGSRRSSVRRSSRGHDLRLVRRSSRRRQTAGQHFAESFLNSEAAGPPIRLGGCVRLGRRPSSPRGRGLSTGAVGSRCSVRSAPPLVQQIINLLFQPGQVVFDGVPNNVDVHVKVTVDHLVAHPTHFDPW
jgi:hypothetical protein